LAAIISSYRNRPLSKETVFIGEVSLVGDVREVFQLDARLKEAHLHSLDKALIAKKPLDAHAVKCFVVDDVNKLIEWM